MLKYKLAQWALGHAALPMAQASGLEGRLRAVLEKNRRREMLTRRALIVAALAAGGVVAPLAALRPVARAQAAVPKIEQKTEKTNPRALQLLTEMGAAYKALGSYSGNEVAEGDQRLGLPYEMNLTFQRPGRIVADITHHDGNKNQRSHILLDGKALYLSSDATPLKVSRVTTARKNHTLTEDALMAYEDVRYQLIVDLLQQRVDSFGALTQSQPGTTTNLGAPPGSAGRG